MCLPFFFSFINSIYNTRNITDDSVLYFYLCCWDEQALFFFSDRFLVSGSEALASFIFSDE